ncbi:MAG: hypothetical protein LC118_11475 [Dehalococcoidia bacterium]|nr:hypothetical protein [Dehalococcoidia bacterium]
MTSARHYTIGEFEISVISDGEFRLDGGAVFGIIPRIMWEPVVGQENIDEHYRIPMGLNCMVVRRNNDVLVVDTGIGAKLSGIHRERTFPGEYGHLLEELHALGIGGATLRQSPTRTSTPTTAAGTPCMTGTAA